MATRGARRHLVTLENPGGATPYVPDGDGGYTTSAVALVPAQMRAEIKPATARDMERTVAGTVTSSATHLVTIDYRSDVTTKTVVRFGTRVFSVTGIANPEEKNRELILTCVEVVS